jgi:predicted O-methyltransferase YrrM
MRISDLNNVIISAPPAPKEYLIGFNFKMPFFSPPVLVVTSANYIHPFTAIWGAVKPKVYLVIGVLYGSSECYAMWKTGHKPNRIVACDVDLAAYNPERNNLAYAYQNLSKDNDAEIVTMRCNSRHCSLMETLGPYDLMFIDGEHTGEAVYADLNHAKKSLAPGGIALVHDLELHSSSVKQGYDKWLKENPQFDHIEVSSKHFQLGLGLVQRR